MRYALALLLTLFASAAFAGTSTPYGGGGWIERFQPVIDEHNRTGELMRIQGSCQSNCTLFLGLNNVCVERSARLLFHAGHGRGQNRYVINAGSTQRMLNAYNSALRQYLVNGRYMETLAFHTISGRDIIDKFGYKECPRR